MWYTHDHLSEYEKLWLWQGHIIRDILANRKLTPWDLVNQITPETASQKDITRITRSVLEFVKGDHSGGSFIHEMLESLNITLPPEHYGEPYKISTSRKEIAKPAKPKKIKKPKASPPRPAFSTCPHCEKVYERADIDLLHYFDFRLLCPHCSKDVGEQRRGISDHYRSSYDP